MCTVGGRIGWIVTRSGTARRPGIPGTTTSLTDFKIHFFRMAKVLKEAALPVEYCAFMVAIMVSRYVVDVGKPNIQQSPEDIKAWSDYLVFHCGLDHINLVTASCN